VRTCWRRAIFGEFGIFLGGKSTTRVLLDDAW
jgi:hypothetical protein